MKESEIGLKIKHIVPTEKATMMIDRENKLQFIVDIRATKKEIKEEIERIFEAKVKKVRTMITPKGEKKAIVEFEEKEKAKEIATSLGIL
ncbi:MAG: 50S ribosomal protein L23 [Candidatus Methanospirareceae archaeon]